jgi:hypothetical protein
VALSLIFGSLILLATPPLRGPDETAHFLRAYGVAQGDLVPSMIDGEKRKGVHIPPYLFEGFDYFEGVRVREKEAGFNYRGVFEAWFSRPPLNSDPAAGDRFVPYGGSEGYSPVTYLPQAVAALLARALDLGFLPTLYAMRFAGLLVLTAVIACAVAIVPNLAWTFLAIAMLPAALYGRSVISADGSALAVAMLVVALWLRGVVTPQLVTPALQSVLMVINALAKPPNLAFVLLESGRLWGSERRVGLFALVVLPAMACAVLWTLVSGADTAAWRMVEITGQELEGFDPLVKLGHLFSDPLRFPTAVLNAWREYGVGELWRQLIGVLGLFDTVLLPWVYPAISVLLAGTFFTWLPIPAVDRYRVRALSAITALAYVFAVYLISWLVFTPPGANAVWGVQGRYFVPILSLIAIVVASIIRRHPGERLTAAMAVMLAVISGCASVEAILRADWLNW